MRRPTAAACLALAALLCACQTDAPRRPMLGEMVDSPQLSVPLEWAVSDIEVELGPELLEHPRRERAEAYGLCDRLFNQIGGEVVAAGRASLSGELLLRVTVTGFRLRSAPLTIWPGTGPDLVAVRVETLRAGQPIHAFETNASSMLGGSELRSGNQRLDRIVRTLARRVLEGLPPED